MNWRCEQYYNGSGVNGRGTPLKTQACQECDFAVVCEKRGFMPSCPLCGTALTPIRTKYEIRSLPPDQGGGVGKGQILGFACRQGTTWLAPENGIDPGCPECGHRLLVIYAPEQYDLQYPDNVVVHGGEIGGYVCRGVLDGNTCSQSWAMTRFGAVKCPECLEPMRIHVASGRFDRPRGRPVAIECRTCSKIDVFA